MAVALALAQFCAPDCKAQSVLDLTTTAPDDGARIKCFGGKGEGESHASRQHRKVGLPLEVTMRGLWPGVVSSGDTLNLEILIRNVGKASILIPAYRNDAEVLRSGNLDQRGLVVGLILTRKGGQNVDVILGATAGSGSVSDSMISLAPQQTLVVRAAGPTTDTWKWNEAGFEIGAVEVRAFVSERLIGFENGCLVINDTTDRAVSTNKMEIVWRR